jgi:hypothetical protein
MRPGRPHRSFFVLSYSFGILNIICLGRSPGIVPIAPMEEGPAEAQSVTVAERRGISLVLVPMLLEATIVVEAEAGLTVEVILGGAKKLGKIHHLQVMQY